MKCTRVSPMLSVVVGFLVFLLSCTVQDTAPVRLSEQGVNLDLINEVAAMPDRQVQKVAFNEVLNSAEKTYLFKQRIVDKQAQLRLTDQQQQHLNTLLRFIPDDLYTNAVKKTERTQFLDKWKAEGEAIFETAVLFDIVGSLSPVNSGIAKVVPTGTVCNCNTAQDFCGDRENCSRIGSCNGSGCGVMWFSRCNGMCDPLPRYYPQ